MTENMKPVSEVTTALLTCPEDEERLELLRDITALLNHPDKDVRLEMWREVMRRAYTDESTTV